VISVETTPTTLRQVFGPDASFHHVGIGVASIERADPAALSIVNRTQGVRMAFVDMNGVTVELLEPLDDSSPIARSVSEGRTLLHLCFEVDDLDAALASAREAGFHRISAPTKVPEWGGRRIVWAFSRQLGLVELAERVPI
jgi:methylmalonyl-CoA/ethylmalonyl-CoA epimerase